MITVIFKPWHRFRATEDDKMIQKWLHDVGDASMQAFNSGMLGAHSGARVTRGRTRSSAGEYPAIQSGLLRSTLRTEYTPRSMTIGTSAPYSGYLADGTTRMEPRSMSDEALREGLSEAGRRLRKWVQWTRY